MLNLVSDAIFLPEIYEEFSLLVHNLSSFKWLMRALLTENI
jgi:hypothetical protein